MAWLANAAGNNPGKARSGGFSFWMNGLAAPLLLSHIGEALPCFQGSAAVAEHGICRSKFNSAGTGPGAEEAFLFPAKAFLPRFEG